jgi:phosphoenolpyruvate synthase/pyruvate phosphate dikinase
VEISLSELVLWLDALRMSDLDKVGGKNASLGEMIGNLSKLGVSVPGGFATDGGAFQAFHRQSGWPAHPGSPRHARCRERRCADQAGAEIRAGSSIRR